MNEVFGESAMRAASVAVGSPVSREDHLKTRIAHLERCLAAHGDKAELMVRCANQNVTITELQIELRRCRGN